MGSVVVANSSSEEFHAAGVLQQNEVDAEQKTMGHSEHATAVAAASVFASASAATVVAAERDLIDADVVEIDVDAAAVGAVGVGFDVVAVDVGFDVAAAAADFDAAAAVYYADVVEVQKLIDVWHQVRAALALGEGVEQWFGDSL